MALYKRGEVWWYKFAWEGQLIRLSSKQGNKRVCEQMQAAHRTSLAKGEVGLRQTKQAPVLREFAEGEFLGFVRSHFAAKPATVAHYQFGVQTLLGFSALAGKRMDEIVAKDVSLYVEHLRGLKYEVSTINRKLAVLLRIFRLAVEWEKLQKAMPRVSLLPGEKRRERVLTNSEEEAYLAAALAIGTENLEAYERAKQGIRATLRDQEPIEPRDPNLLFHVAVVLLDCGLRPEELYRLRLDEYKDGALHIQYGKTSNARRIVPASARAKTILDWRVEQFGGGEWVFSAETKCGHINQSSLKKQHQKACTAAGVAFFVPYMFRHTRLTRWAQAMDPYTLAYLAGHSDFATTKRYVHPRAEAIRAAVERAEQVSGGHKIRHSDPSSPNMEKATEATIQ